MKNLVMSVAAGYGWNDLEPFVNSFKKNCTSADLVLFVDNISDFTLKRLSEEKVKLVPFPNELKNKLIVNSRWEMYKDFLEKNTEYENIFVTDVRDVIFQGDLFTNYANYKNSLIYSTENVLIKNDPPNGNWIKNFLGMDKYLEIQDEFSICAGMIFGSHKEINIFFEKMIEFLSQSVSWGDDQAAMNYLVHRKLLPIENIFASTPENGELLNTFWITNRVFNNNFVRLDGKVPAVIHEYDRRPQMIQIVDKVYRENDFKFDENFTDISSAIDQMFCLVQRKKWNDDTRFLQNCIMQSPDVNFHTIKLLKLRELLKKAFL